jgi:ribonuclease E
MTRKRVGQGLIEAFSTTCDACSGRGLHIHMEPVKMKAPMPQLDVPSAKHEDADETDATEHEFHESINADVSDEAPAEIKPVQIEAKTGGRKRRRASSSGIITA